ncbi:acyl transferase/acyl hydrolase/lysophospholipase [Suillus discolor]|uniref:Patatin-like phospholipase domain-containing protein n=1 Tax=Suillus discolor TaxID=1912936 RepID=A0A9P7JLU1_9AGAM|nr:acyl transferase/acyl hydrolase/lysophospholipase [Suillus discolor]KAG2088483.1 acyl transferase/acyl hydrolase/lysophospholipase [Suillus discolor]
MEVPADLLDSGYVNELHIQAFIDALQSDDLDGHDALSAASPHTVPSSPVPQSPRVRKVSALSDFAPINLKVKRKRKGDKSPGRRQEWSFLVLRWPLLFLIFIFIAAQFGFYILIRQLVNTKEWLLAWRGQKGLLRKRLRGARTYQEWKETAMMLDKYLMFNDWKKVDEDAFYDWKLLRKVNRSLKILREKKDVRGVLGVLETCIRSNFVGVESSRLYSETFLGTKDLIESYHTELQSSLQFVRESSELSIEEKRKFFKNASTNLGASALCLSGGASFGYYHFGVVKAFLDAGLLPRVIAGTSAGGLVAALVCTRTDAELKTLLVPELAQKLTACEDSFTVWIKHFWATGARFDSVVWARKCTFFTRGSMTFREAYLRTGRILNISVVPADRHAPTKLLNYMTAPDTIIWTALLASAAVPGILNPVVLMQKLHDGRVVPWNWGSKFKDGSLRVDIPLQALKMYFNVTHPVVSQVNPHVHLFFFAPRGSAGKPVAHRKGKGWRGNFLLSAAEQWLKLELTKNFKVIRDLELLPQLLGQDWSSVFLQRFDGAVTIWPRTRILDWLHILSDPDSVELERMIKVGQIATWPKLHMIENRFRIENEILMGRQAVRIAMDQIRSRTNPGDTRNIVVNGQAVPEPVTGSRLRIRSESPIPLDSDTERAFKDNGTAWYFRRGRPTAGAPRESETSTPYENNYNNITDPLRSPVLRRKWASELLDRNDDSGAGNSSASPRTATPEPSANEPRQNTSNSSTFFRRLGPGSVSIPFSGSHRPSKSSGRSLSVNASEFAWSSESSSDDELDHLPPQSALYLNTELNEDAVSDEEGMDQD